MYRHVDALTAAGILEVAQERRVGGAVERLYPLVAEFDAYLAGENADPAADLVGFRQHALWLSREELEQLITELRAVIVPRLANQPGPGRDQYLLSPIHFPIEQGGE